MRHQKDSLGYDVIITNKYIICDHIFGVFISNLQDESWEDAAPIDKLDLNQFISYSDIKDLLQYSDDYVNEQIDRYFNLLIFT